MPLIKQKRFCSQKWYSELRPHRVERHGPPVEGWGYPPISKFCFCFWFLFVCFEECFFLIRFLIYLYPFPISLPESPITFTLLLLLLECSLTHTLLPPHPVSPLLWSMKISQDHGPLLPLMSNKAIFYIHCWRHESLHVYSLVGCLVPGSSWGSVVWYCCSFYVVANPFSSLSQKKKKKKKPRIVKVQRKHRDKNTSRIWRKGYPEKAQPRDSSQFQISNLILLLKPKTACWQDPGTAIRERLCWHQTNTDADTYSQPLYPNGRIRWRNEGAKGDCNTIGKTTILGNQMSQSSQGLNHTWRDPWLQLHM